MNYEYKQKIEQKKQENKETIVKSVILSIGFIFIFITILVIFKNDILNNPIANLYFESYKKDLESKNPKTLSDYEIHKIQIEINKIKQSNKAL